MKARITLYQLAERMEVLYENNNNILVKYR